VSGRAAEELVFNEITTGASIDIERATQLARQMVTMYGMSEKFGMVGLESIQNRYLDGRPVRNCSDETSSEVDREVMNIISKSYEKAKSLLKDNMEALCKISSHLILKETIMGDEFMEFLNALKEARLSKEVLGRITPIIPDHMYREECYYLTKLSQVSSVKKPGCDPGKPRIEI
jgi:cell division protease FtsH